MGKGNRHLRFNAKARQESKNASNKGSGVVVSKNVISNNNNDEEYIGSTTSNPVMIIPKNNEMNNDNSDKQDQSNPSNRYDLLPNPPSQDVKLSKTKRKRLEKFISKQLKKEERASLFSRVSELQSHNADMTGGKTELASLLKSSKDFGKKTVSNKDRLTRALNEYKVGIHISDREGLFVEKEVDESELLSTVAATSNLNDDDNEGMNVEADANNTETSTTTVQTIVFDGFNKTECSTTIEQHPKKVFGGALKPSASTFGAALKRKPEEMEGGQQQSTGLLDHLPKRAKKKKQKKSKAKKDENRVAFGSSDDEENDDEEEDSNDSQEEESSDEEMESETKPSLKSKAEWKVDVIQGEAESVPKHNVSTSNKSKQQQQQSKPKLTSTPITPATKTQPFHVPVHRPEEIQVSRLELPVCGAEQEIMETILSNSVTILCGETGSGKTTQLPQFLFEYGFSNPSHPDFPGIIGITQPRRVAAVSMAKRVSEEMGLVGTKQVGYQIRYDKTTDSKETRIKFMTDGVLLRELTAGTNTNASQSGNKGDMLLTQYSAIIIDEAHERTVGTDVLIGWLTRIVKLRNSGSIANIKPLKLIIMSATLRVEDFVENETLFPSASIPSTNLKTHQPQPTPANSIIIPPKNPAKPPVLKIDGRQHKVVIHYNKKTPMRHGDMIEEVISKVSKIHTRLPPGGILVFLTGQQEITDCCRRLKRAFPIKKNNHQNHSMVDASESSEQEEEEEEQVENDNAASGVIDEIPDNMDTEFGRGDGDQDADDDYAESNEDDDDDGNSEEEETHVLGGHGVDEDIDEDEEDMTPMFGVNGDNYAPLHVLPLYSLLSTEAQLKVFSPPPEGHRLCVLATNIAETSLTIPGIKYVIDGGKVKQREWDHATGIAKYTVDWTSKASSNQRAGRAGRVGPGHCYRLFSSAVYENSFPIFTDPEILKTPIESVILSMKAMGISNVPQFPFPTAPDSTILRRGEALLESLGALERVNGRVTRVTELGSLMAKLPVAPRYAKMMIIASQQSTLILPYVITVVAGLSVGDPFIRDIDLFQNGSGGKNGGNDNDNNVDDDDENENNDEEKEMNRRRRQAYYKMMALFSTGANGGSSAVPIRSDLFKLLNVVGAYEIECLKGLSHGEAFCERAFVRPKAMDEIRKLRRQLTNIIQSSGIPLSTEVAHALLDPKMKPPTLAQQTLILQTLLACFPDHVAKMIPPPHPKISLPTYDLLTGSSYYAQSNPLSAIPNKLIQIHPSSALYHARKDDESMEWILYLELSMKDEVRSADGAIINDVVGEDGKPKYNKISMKWITSIDPRWLPKVLLGNSSTTSSNADGFRLCRYKRILDIPEPFYDANVDDVFCYIVPEFAGRYELDTIKVSMPLDKLGNGDVATGSTNGNCKGGLVEKCKWFARALLEGKVFGRALNDASSSKKPKSKSKSKQQREPRGVFGLVSRYMSPLPSTITKPTHFTAQTSHKIKGIVEPLVRAGVYNFDGLCREWERNPSFLRDGIVDGWIHPNAFGGELCEVMRRQWPPMVSTGKDSVNNGSGYKENGALFDAVQKLVATSGRSNSNSGHNVRDDDSEPSDYDSE